MSHPGHVDPPVILDAEAAAEAAIYGEPELCCVDAVRRLTTDVGRNAAPWLLAEIDDALALPRGWLPELVTEAWSVCEWPEPALGRDRWLRLWRDCGGYVCDGRRRARPRKPWRLYRGADEAHAEGMAWTTDRLTAQWFADRLPGAHVDGEVWTVLAPPESVLAKITIRSEAEVVIDPAGLEIEPLRRTERQVQADREAVERQCQAQHAASMASWPGGGRDPAARR